MQLFKDHIGTLRRAHSEELISEVGLEKPTSSSSNEEDFNNNNSRLRVSDKPRHTRVRRNSAGDEISAILDQENDDHGGLRVLDQAMIQEDTGMNVM